MSIADLRKIMEVKRYSENTILTYCSFISKIERELNIPVNRLSETYLHGYVYSQIAHLTIFSRHKPLPLLTKDHPLKLG